MKRAQRALIIALCWGSTLSACGSTVVETSQDASIDGASLEDGGDVEAIACPATPCPSGAACCVGTGRCFRLANEATACPRPPQDAMPNRTCSANTQCAAGEFCISDNARLCQGPGHCLPRSNCGSCTGANCTVCGCDGANYPSIQAACRAGVRSSSAASGACGVSITGDAGVAQMVPCGFDAQCPAEMRCCTLTGACVARACEGCCVRPPPGTLFPCADNTMCRAFELCIGDGCGTPGGCARRENQSRCTGAVEPVCGCNGTRYINACWASVAGERVTTDARCPAP